MNKTLEYLRSCVQDEMAQLDEMRRIALTSSNPLLELALKHVASRQGKMMRPMLAFMVGKTYEASKPNTEKLLHAALALELLHTASLVHDDVVDESDRRRGQASINALYDNQAAVLVGDYILSLALSEAARTGSPHFVEALACLGQELSDGELLQLHNMGCEEISEEQYYEVIRRKTASLFATCASACEYFSEMQQMPLLRNQPDGNANYKQHSVAYRLGELIGIIFQMRDDIFDLTGTAGTDKPAGNDLLEGKLTLPVIHAVLCNEALRPAALRVRHGDSTEDDRRALSHAARTCGLAYAEDQMQQMIDEAHSIVDRLAATSDENIAAGLHAYIDYAAKRDI